MFDRQKQYRAEFLYLFLVDSKPFNNWALRARCIMTEYVQWSVDIKYVQWSASGGVQTSSTSSGVRPMECRYQVRPVEYVQWSVDIKYVQWSTSSGVQISRRSLKLKGQAVAQEMICKDFFLVSLVHSSEVNLPAK